MFTVSTAQLKRFVNRCIVFSRGLTGTRTPYLTDLIISCEQNTMNVFGVGANNSILINFSLDVNCEEPTDLFISDSVDFLKIIKDGFLGVLNVSTTYESITLESNKIVSYPMENVQIKSAIDFQKYYSAMMSLSLGTSIVANSKDISDAVKKTNHRYELFEYQFMVENGMFYVSILNRDGTETKTSIPADVVGGDCIGVYAIGVDCVFKDLGKEVTINMDTNMPMMVEDNNGDKAVFFPIEYLD